LSISFLETAGRNSTNKKIFKKIKKNHWKNKIYTPYGKFAEQAKKSNTVIDISQTATEFLSVKGKGKGTRFNDSI